MGIRTPSRSATARFVLAAAVLLSLQMATVFAQTVEESQKGKLVSGFPAIPIYPQSIVEYSERVVEGTKTAFEADLVSNDAVFDVYSYYLETLKQDGWVIRFASGNTPTAKEQGLGAVKDNLRIYIEVEEEAGETHIEIEVPLQERKGG